MDSDVKTSKSNILNDVVDAEVSDIYFIKTAFPLFKTNIKCDEERPYRSDGGQKKYHQTDVGVEVGEAEVDISGHRCTGHYWQIASLISCFITNVLSGGISNSYGVLYTYMQVELGWSELDISWIGSLMTGFHGIASIVATILIDRSGCRVTTILGPILAATGFITASLTSNIFLMYLTLGALPGVGVCLSYTATLVHVNRQFTRWRPFAVALSVVGTAVGILVWPPLTSYMAESMGWRGALLINGAFLLHLVPCALLIRSEKATQTVDTSSKSQSTSNHQSIRNYFQIFRIRGTITVALVNFFTGLSYYTFSTFIPYYLTASRPDMTSTDAAFIISFVGFGSVAGRFIFAGASMVHFKAPQNIYTFSLCMCGIANILVPLCGNMSSDLANGVFYGFGLGGWNTMASVVYVNLFGIDNISKTFGTFNCCLGIGAFCGPPLESYISSLMGSPAMIFYSAGGFYVISSILMLSLVVKSKGVIWRRKSLNISVIGQKNEGFTANESTCV